MALKENLRVVFDEPALTRQPQEAAPSNNRMASRSTVLERLRLPSKRTVVALGGASIAIATGIVWGLNSSDTSNSPSGETPLSSTGGYQNSGPAAPNHIQESYSEPWDFTLTTADFNTKDGYSTFGDYGVYNQKLSSVVSGQRFDISIESARVILKTYSISDAITFKDGPVDAQADTVTKIATIDPSKLAFGAELTDVKLSIGAVSPGEQLKANGNYDAGCKVLQVWGCPNNMTPPTNLAIPKEVSDVLIASAKNKILDEVEKDCAQLEYLNTFRFIGAILEKQAKEQHVRAGLITLKVVGSELKTTATTVPNYPYPLQQELSKQQGAALAGADMVKVFGTSSIQATCKPMDVNKAK